MSNEAVESGKIDMSLQVYKVILKLISILAMLLTNSEVLTAITAFKL